MSERFGLSLSLEAFWRLWGDLALLGPRSREAERDDERPLLHELLRCRRFCLLRDSSFFLPDGCRPGDGDWLWWWAGPRPERWWRFDECPPFAFLWWREPLPLWAWLCWEWVESLL